MPSRSAISISRAIRSSGVRPSTTLRWLCKSQIVNWFMAPPSTGQSRRRFPAGEFLLEALGHQRQPGAGQLFDVAAEDGFLLILGAQGDAGRRFAAHQADHYAAVVERRGKLQEIWAHLAIRIEDRDQHFSRAAMANLAEVWADVAAGIAKPVAGRAVALENRSSPLGIAGQLQQGLELGHDLFSRTVRGGA